MASAEATKGPENTAQGFREAQPAEEERVEKVSTETSLLSPRHDCSEMCVITPLHTFKLPQSKKHICRHTHWVSS